MKLKPDNEKALLFILPTLLIVFLVHVLPILSSVYFSLLELNIYTLRKFFLAPFIWLKNYINILSGDPMIGDEFLISLRNILIFGFIVVQLNFIIAMSVSLFLNQKMKGKSFYITLILIPFFTMDTVFYGIWSLIFSSDGILNTFLKNIGLIKDNLIWLIGDRAMIPPIVATVAKTWPFLCIILLAGMQNIRSEIYEASAIDGANRFQQFTKITLPLLWPVIRTMFIISIIWIIQSYNNFLIMVGLSPGRNAIIPSINIVKQLSRNMDYGAGSAMGVLLLIMIIILTFFIIIKKNEEYS